MKSIVVCLLFVAVAFADDDTAGGSKEKSKPTTFAACVADVKARQATPHVKPTPNPAWAAKKAAVKACVQKCTPNPCDAAMKAGAEANKAAVKKALEPFISQFKTAKGVLLTCLETSTSCSSAPMPKAAHTPRADNGSNTHCEKGVLAILHGPPSACVKACFPPRNASASGKGDHGDHHRRRRHHNQVGCFKDFCSKDVIEGCATKAGLPTLKDQAKAAVKAAVTDNFSTNCNCLLKNNPKPAVSVNCAAPTATECAAIKTYMEAQHPRSKRDADMDLGMDDDEDEDEDVEGLLDD